MAKETLRAVKRRRRECQKVEVILLRQFRTPTDDSSASRTLTGINEEHFSSFGKALRSLENLHSYREKFNQPLSLKTANREPDDR